MRFTGHVRAILDTPGIPGVPAEYGAILMVEPLTSYPKEGLKVKMDGRSMTVVSVMANHAFFDPKLEGCIGIAVDEHGLEAEGLAGAFIYASGQA